MNSQTNWATIIEHRPPFVNAGPQAIRGQVCRLASPGSKRAGSVRHGALNS